MIYFVVFLVIFILRWTSLDKGLPIDWTPDKQIGYTALIFDFPDQKGSKMVINNGRWRVFVDQYESLKIGNYYRFSGKVETRLLGDKYVKIEMKDPIIEDMGPARNNVVKGVLLSIFQARRSLLTIFQSRLPEPHSSLVAGILLGVRSRIPYDFYQKLVDIGVVHVIAASGYNVAILLNLVFVPLALIFHRSVAIIVAVFALLLYTIMAGASAAIIRASLMGSLTLFAYYTGRKAEALRLLIMVGAIMLVIQPLVIIDIGFWLSFAATFGLLRIEPIMKSYLDAYFSKVSPNNWHESLLQRILSIYLYPSLAAYIATLPIIIWVFGRASIVSPVANLLILPVVPLIMNLGLLQIVFSWVPILDKLIAIFLYLPLQYFVVIVRMIANG